MFTPRNILVAAIAGIVGCIANSIAITLVAGAPLGPLILSLGREVFSILFALLLIPIFARMNGAAAWITGIVALDVISSLVAKLVFAAGAPWGLVLFFNGIYAIAAVAVYAAGRERTLRARA